MLHFKLDGIQMKLYQENASLFERYEDHLDTTYMYRHNDSKRWVIGLKIGFIGAGKVGFSLGKHFVLHGMNVLGYYSRNSKSSKEAAEFTETKYYEELASIVKECDILFITVPDGNIREVYNQIIQMEIKGKYLVHCSGALSSEVFSGISKYGAKGCSIHPICAVSDMFTGYQELSKAYYTIEGNDVETIAELIRDCGNVVEVISADMKSQYHASAVFASNLVVGLYDMATKLLKECGLSEEFSEKALQSLFMGNAESIAVNGVVQALTGPIERGDIKTVEKHLIALNGKEREVYLALSKELIDVAMRKNPERDYSEIQKILYEE